MNAIKVRIQVSEAFARKDYPLSAQTPWRVLVVDDDEDERLLLALMLKRAGYDVTTARDGEAAWAALNAGSFDLLCTDLNMPNLGGLDLVDRVRHAGCVIPIVIHSGCPESVRSCDYSRLCLAAVIAKSDGFTEALKTIALILPLPRTSRDEAHRKSPSCNEHSDGDGNTPVEVKIISNSSRFADI